MACRLAGPNHVCLDIYGYDVSGNPDRCSANMRAEARELTEKVYGRTLILEGDMNARLPDGQSLPVRVVIKVPGDFIDAWKRGAA